MIWRNLRCHVRGGAGNHGQYSCAAGPPHERF
jgi:hypothetical protein